ncbi:hypothetical protein B2J93_2472 [Marssonina coronariae]|uniref:Uncharacterized protein n=1 Tax=Diplocarpon coronariae TaxID=2795749 RepID=A0A218YSU2_9HELO|nr:hypothetical protein B2J93_2472 [Marssonina coronariae]
MRSPFRAVHRIPHAQSRALATRHAPFSRPHLVRNSLTPALPLLLAAPTQRNPTTIRARYSVPVPAPAQRALSASARLQKWEGRKAEDNTVREGDAHNVQHDASREGKAERARGGEEGSRGATEQAGDANRKAKEEFPEAPDTLGMQDDRGGKD